MITYKDFFKLIEFSWSKFLNRKTLLIIGLDVFFLFLYFLIKGFFGSLILENLIKATPLLLQRVGKGVSLYSSIFAPEIIPFTTKIVYLITITVLLQYFVYCLIQGIVWSIVLKEKSLKDYLKFFFEKNLLILIGCLLLYFINFILELRKIILEKIISSSNIPFIIIAILFILLFCYAIITYVAKDFSKTNKLIKNNLLNLLIMFLFIFIVLLVVDFVQLASINQTLAVIFSFTLLFSSIAYLRYFVKEMIKYLNTV